IEKSIQFKSQILHYNTNIFLNPFLESTISLQTFNCSWKSPIFTISSVLSTKTQIQKPIICAKISKREMGLTDQLSSHLSWSQFWLRISRSYFNRWI
ncbi:hypothetical protein Gohar_014727, partial [Gossypium harknessii]|nr:hypothetical protein [Gossypium harknessii]